MNTFVLMTRRHLPEIVNGKELSDLHIHAFQNIVKGQFPHIAGLLNPVFQESTPLQYNTKQTALQVLHVDRQMPLGSSPDKMFLYDSAYPSASKYTLEVIAKLI